LVLGRRGSYYEPRRQFDSQGLDSPSVEHAKQQADGHAAHLGEGLAHGRELRGDEFRPVDVVETDDRQVLRDS
jgi:hypothetical protein